MKSSLSSSYKKASQADGSMKFTYRSSLLLSPHLPSLIIIFSPPCAILLFLFATSASHNTFSATAGIFLIVFFSFRFCFGKTHSIIVKPKEGIFFGDKRLSFAEIESYGVASIFNSGRESGYVYAESQGRFILITKYIGVATAKALRQEIESYINIKS